jgi:hypothetical protein
MQDGELVGGQRPQDGLGGPRLSGGLRRRRGGRAAPGSGRAAGRGLFPGVELVEDLPDEVALGTVAVALPGKAGAVYAGGPGAVPPGGEEPVAGGEFGVGDLVGGPGAAELAGEQLGGAGGGVTVPLPPKASLGSVLFGPGAAKTRSASSSNTCQAGWTCRGRFASSPQPSIVRLPAEMVTGP